MAWSENIKTAWIAAGAVVISALIAGAVQLLSKPDASRPPSQPTVERERTARQLFQPSDIEAVLATLKVHIKEGSRVTITIDTPNDSIREGVRAQFSQVIEEDATLSIVPEHRVEHLLKEQRLNHIETDVRQQLKAYVDYVLVIYPEGHSLLLIDTQSSAQIISLTIGS